MSFGRADDGGVSRVQISFGGGSLRWQSPAGQSSESRKVPKAKKSRKWIWGRREVVFALRIWVRREGSARAERGLGHLGRLRVAVDAAFAVFSVFEVRLSGGAVIQYTDFQ